MDNVFVRFEREGIDGLAAVGSSIGATARRFGIREEPECTGDSHHCSVAIISGADILSPLTAVESEHFAAHGRRSNERLACEARFIKPGEIVIMNEEKKQEQTASGKDRFQQEFDALPLDQKFASLFRMEAAVIGEAFDYMVNSPMKVVEKVGDVITELGMKIETEARKAATWKTCPPEQSEPKRPAATPKGKGKAAPPPPPPSAEI